VNQCCGRTVCTVRRPADAPTVTGQGGSGEQHATGGKPTVCGSANQPRRQHVPPTRAWGIPTVRWQLTANHALQYRNRSASISSKRRILNQPYRPQPSQPYFSTPTRYDIDVTPARMRLLFSRSAEVPKPLPEIPRRQPCHADRRAASADFHAFRLPFRVPDTFIFAFWLSDGFAAFHL